MRRALGPRDAVGFGCISVLLTVVFFTDGFSAEFEGGDVKPRAAEALIYGRLAKSRRDGVFSSAGLLGQCAGGGAFERWNVAFQEKLYEKGVCDEYTAYYSQTGLQGMLFSTLDRVGLPPAAARGVAAACMALALTLLFAGVAVHFGTASAGIGLALTLLHRWPILLGDNLLMFFGWMFAPMIALSWAFHRRSRHVLLVAMVALTARWLMTGAEYLFAGISMSFVALVFYGIERRMPPERVAREALRVAGGTLISLALRGGLLVAQIASQSSLGHARDHVVYTIGKRTWGDPASYPSRFEADLSAPVGAVVRSYLAFPAVRLPGVSSTFGGVVLIAFAFTVLALAMYLQSQRRALLALVVATWASAIAPLSWLVLAKAHAHRHVWVDPIVWYMPFLLLCNALAGVAVAGLPSFARAVLHGRRAAPHALP